MTYGRAVRAAAGAWFAVVLGVVACSAKNDGAANDPSCTAEAPPSTCPSAVPSWSTEVSEIFAVRCSPCHFPGGVQASAEDYSTYAGVARVTGTIEGQVASCAMPPSDAGALSSGDRAALLTWIVCGAPNN